MLCRAAFRTSRIPVALLLSRSLCVIQSIKKQRFFGFGLNLGVGLCMCIVDVAWLLACSNLGVAANAAMSTVCIIPYCTQY